MIKDYIKENLSWYIYQIFIIFSYWIVFKLYHFHLEYFYTAFGIQLLGLALLTGYRFIKYHQKITTLTFYKKGDVLNFKKTPSDLKYEYLITKIILENSEEQLKMTKKLSDYERLIKIWSHQMKVPISAISLMQQTNKLTPLEVEQQLLKLENYIENLISYSKLNDYQDDFRFREFSVATMVKSILKKKKIFFITKSIAVKLRGDWIIKSDEKWLEFALSQIIDNAVKYSYSHSNIEIILKQGSIIIRDYGIGILKEDIPRLFEEGFTGFNGHEHKKATGLGLYMTKQILSRLYLNIFIDSCEESGTIVTVSVD